MIVLASFCFNMYQIDIIMSKEQITIEIKVKQFCSFLPSRCYHAFTSISMRLSIFLLYFRVAIRSSILFPSLKRGE